MVTHKSCRGSIKEDGKHNDSSGQFEWNVEREIRTTKRLPIRVVCD
jgi:hypothetical protein